MFAYLTIELGALLLVPDLDSGHSIGVNDD